MQLIDYKNIQFVRSCSGCCNEHLNLTSRRVSGQAAVNNQVRSGLSLLVLVLPPQFFSSAAAGAHPLSPVQPQHLHDAPGVGVPQVHASRHTGPAHRAAGQPLQHLALPHRRLLHLHGEVAGGEALVDDGDGERQDQDPRQDAEEGQHLPHRRVRADVSVSHRRHGGGRPPPSDRYAGEGGGGKVVLQGEDHRGEDGDTDTEEEEKEADLLVALSDGHPQRLEAWTGMRTEEYFSFIVPTFSCKPHPEKSFQFSHLADLAATIMNCFNVTFPKNKYDI